MIRTDIITGEDKFYPSILDASKEGFCQHSIVLCCKNIHNLHKNYMWRYSKETKKSLVLKRKTESLSIIRIDKANKRI